MRRTHLCLAAVTALGATLLACGGTDEGASECTPGPELTVGGEDDLQFDAESYATEAGCIEVTYVNNGSVPHTLLVRGESGFKLSMGSEDVGNIELPAGTFELYCDIAGHEAAGMVADLVVE